MAATLLALLHRHRLLEPFAVVVLLGVTSMFGYLGWHASSALASRGVGSSAGIGGTAALCGLLLGAALGLHEQFTGGSPRSRPPSRRQRRAITAVTASALSTVALAFGNEGEPFLLQLQAQLVVSGVMTGSMIALGVLVVARMARRGSIRPAPDCSPRAGSPAPPGPAPPAGHP